MITITIMAMITTIITSMTTALKHYHDEDMQSISLSTDKPLDPDKFFPWMQNLVAAEGPNILRSQGHPVASRR